MLYEEEESVEEVDRQGSFLLVRLVELACPKTRYARFEATCPEGGGVEGYVED